MIKREYGGIVQFLQAKGYGPGKRNPRTGVNDRPPLIVDPIENPLLEAYGGPYAYVNGRPTVFVDPDRSTRLAEVGQDAGSQLKSGVTAAGRFVAEHPDEIIAGATIAACATGVGCGPALLASGAWTTARVTRAARDSDWGTAAKELAFAAVRPANPRCERGLSSIRGRS